MPETSSGEKTELPSQKKRDDARKEGQVAFSKELSSTILLGSILLLFYFSGSSAQESMAEFLTIIFQNIDLPELDIPLLQQLFDKSIKSSTLIVVPFFSVILVVGILISVMQVGVNFTLKPLQPKLSKLNPLKGLGRIFSKQALVEFLKSIFKLTVIGYIGYFTFRESIDVMSNLIETNPKALLLAAASIIGNFTLKLFIALLVMAIFDYMFQLWDLEQKLKMTKQEVKDEYKQMEGDPILKSRIRQIQQQMSQARMMQEVPEADVVLTNPTHFAIAMKYDRDVMVAPQVIAKGVDHIALRIIDIAKENEVIVYESATMARALYFQVEIGEGIPEEFYKAIAEILAFVYKTRNKK
jgi:flagellar biosynthetic protein FlhB